MPEMNGYDATKEIRAHEKQSDLAYGVPIIAMTADAMSGTREACLAVGMNEYISKPIDEAAFRLLLQNWFVLLDEEQKQGNTPIQRSLSKEAVPADLSLLKEYSDNDPDTERELIAAFYKKSMEDIRIMTKNTIKANHTVWSETAHGLKGSAGYVGADKLQALCQEAQILQDGSAKERRQLLKKIEKEHKKVCVFLRQEGLLDADELL